MTALDPSHKKGRYRCTWSLSISELDELERFIAHDEKLYAQYFGKPNYPPPTTVGDFLWRQNFKKGKELSSSPFLLSFPVT